MVGVRVVEGLRVVVGVRVLDGRMVGELVAIDIVNEAAVFIPELHEAR
jgi:hypothetical protein